MSFLIRHIPRLRFSRLRSGSRKEIARLLRKAGHGPASIARFLDELDRAVGWCAAFDGAQRGAPKPASMKKRLEKLERHARWLGDEIRALQAEQPFMWEGICHDYGEPPPGKEAARGVETEALLDHLHRLAQGVRLEQEFLNPTRGNPGDTNVEELLGEVGKAFARWIGRPTATKDNLFEGVLGLVLSAVVGERSEDRMHQLAAGVVNSLRIDE